MSDRTTKAWAENIPPGTAQLIADLTRDEPERWALLADLLEGCCRQMSVSPAALKAALSEESARDKGSHPGRFRGPNSRWGREAQAYWAARWATWRLGNLLVSGLPEEKIEQTARAEVTWWWACATLAAETAPAP